ncbi:hypothetical protein DACRYDRAFT_113822 [Dacryopinax primogenitus]|uniref:rRNA-processing protein FYV7 n=1 Tax=Dacryopinax primogenitus (strain DJM 731) TaxID=1858805 RepID=M5GBJ7_DACPD|nr:uncharacterized protein DACRYDRAFT_113822 [Dacryopinax primogenitus]EJU05775.1 hypothetical protein DACRYDRAFT_113822 [Dacryopinax primogenitus]
MRKPSSRRPSDTTDTLSHHKRKTPPKFQHLPHATARKLKQQWVERKKLQSRYFGKGKGRKEDQEGVAGGDEEDGGEDGGRAVGNTTRGGMEDDEEEFVGFGLREGDDEAMHDSPTHGEVSEPEDIQERPDSLTSSHQRRSSLKQSSHSTPQEPRSLPARVPSSRPAGAKGYSGGSPLERVNRKGSVSHIEENGKTGRVGKHPTLSREERQRKEKEEREETARRRARAKEAYDRGSLHTYRSDPLGRQTAGKGQRKGDKGKGQPDMRLRMNVLLEQIKRNVGA